MLIGIISDVHGNSYALEQVLKKAAVANVQHLLILGDIVGYYYHPDKVLEMLSAWPHSIIQGNHESMMVQAQNDDEARLRIRKKYGRGLEIGMEKLGRQSINYLTDLPKHQKLTYDDCSLLICHGSPWDRDEYIYPDADKNKLAKFMGIEADFIFMGHTHYPCIFHLMNKLVVNPGSVGQSRQTGGLACWGILNTTNKIYTPQSTLYDTNALLAEIKEIDPDILYLTEILNRR